MKSRHPRRNGERKNTYVVNGVLLPFEGCPRIRLEMKKERKGNNIETKGFSDLTAIRISDGLIIWRADF